MSGGNEYRARITSDLLCSSRRAFTSYFSVYDNLFKRCDHHVLQIESPGPRGSVPISHDNIITATQMLRNNPQLTLMEAVESLRDKLAGSHSNHQLTHAIYIAVRAMIMLDCAPSGNDSASAWQPHEKYIDFVNRCLPYTTIIGDKVQESIDRNAMKAWKLRGRFGIYFKGTDTISWHLRLDLTDPVGPTLYLFHHASFLKAQLECLARKGHTENDDVSSCLVSGYLAPRLLAETLHSLQDILFKFDDIKSQKILRRLINNRDGFDEDCAVPEGYKFQAFTSTQDLRYYRYLGGKLAILDGFMQDRPPRNKFERWMKWQTSESNAFAVALTALLISIIVGILTLGLSGFQAWVAWKAWKDSTSTGEVSISLEDLLEWARLQQDGIDGPLPGFR